MTLQSVYRGYGNNESGLEINYFNILELFLNLHKLSKGIASNKTMIGYVLYSISKHTTWLIHTMLSFKKKNSYSKNHQHSLVTTRACDSELASQIFRCQSNTQQLIYGEWLLTTILAILICRNKDEKAADNVFELTRINNDPVAIGSMKILTKY